MILEGCKDRKMGNGGAGQRFLRAAKVDDSRPTVVQVDLRGAKVD